MQDLIHQLAPETYTLGEALLDSINFPDQVDSEVLEIKTDALVSKLPELTPPKLNIIYPTESAMKASILEIYEVPETFWLQLATERAEVTQSMLIKLKPIVKTSITLASEPKKDTVQMGVSLELKGK